MWELDHKEGWMSKEWCFWTVVLEKTLESLLDNMEIKLVNPKGNQSWIYIGRTDVEAETLILWLPGGFPGGSEDKVSACNVGDPGSIPGLGRSPGKGNGNPLQYSCLENPWTEEPGGLQSTGSQRVGHDWATSHTHLRQRADSFEKTLMLGKIEGKRRNGWRASPI